MDKKIKKIILFLGIIFAFFLKANFVLALDVIYPDITVLGQRFHVDSTSTFPEYFCYFFGLIQDLAIFIAVITIAYGGICYLISYGRGKFTSEAKEWIKAGITGLLIVVCAYLIAYTINPDLTTCKLGVLSLINFNPSPNSTIPPGVTVTTFKEIPIGTLTENLLTGTMDCYGFDQNGNIILKEIKNNKKEVKI